MPDGRPEPDCGQRHAPRQHEPPAERQLRRVPGHLSRPPQRLSVLRVAGRRHVRRRDRQRADQQRRLEHDLGREGHAFAGGLDRRDRDSVQVAALPARPRADLGHQPAADDPRQERVRLRRADQARMGRRRVLPRVGGRHARRPRGAHGRQEPGDQAVRRVAADDRPACSARRSERL